MGNLVYRGLALLLIACPCALVISTPAAITSGLAAATRRGALIKGGAALEQLGNIESVAFDKTGTLTLGKPQVTDVIVSGALTEQELLAATASIEQGSNHPLAISLVRHVERLGLTIPSADEQRALVGVGVEG
ncbi:copper-translocating P-type ATPase [Vibrio maritimus]|uniref:Copper-translocating P-type ATPase n=1 Tax=Vibrio maritimus TaxID=990268 RepID=A0A090SR92_9VIBR|nr:copper-translocating P-type ATPase [Vibrio maritimus]